MTRWRRRKSMVSSMTSAWMSSSSPGLTDLSDSLGGGLPAVHFLHVVHAAAPRHALAEQGHDLALGPAAQVVVFVQDHAVEGVAEQFALADHVAVAAVAGGRVDDGAPLVRELLEGLDQGRRAPRGCGRSRR